MYIKNSSNFKSGANDKFFIKILKVTKYVETAYFQFDH